MRDQIRFAAWTTAVACLLSLIWAPIDIRLSGAPLLGDGRFLIPFLAAMMCARGVSPVRRVMTAILTLEAWVVVNAIMILTGVQALALGGLAWGASLAGSAATVGYHVFRMAAPMAVFVVFVGKDPSILWVARPDVEAAQAQDGAS